MAFSLAKGLKETSKFLDGEDDEDVLVCGSLKLHRHERIASIYCLACLVAYK